MYTDQIRSWIALCEARSTGPTFATIARYPKRYIYDLIDHAVRMQEDLSDWMDEPEGDDDEDDDLSRYGSLIYQLQNSAKKFLSHIKAGKATVYRGIVVEKGWNPAKEGLGIYWTIRESAAFHGILLEGVIREQDINLWDTLVMDTTALTEDEIRLLPTATILLTSIKLNGKPVMQQFWGQTYPAVVGSNHLTRDML